MNVSALIFLTACTLITRWAWRRGAHAVAFGFAAAAVLFAVSLWRSSNPAALTLVLLVAGLIAWQRWGRTAATIGRI